MPVDVAVAVEARLPCNPQWGSQQVVVTPEMLGLRSTVECQQRADKLGLTPMPPPPYRQQYWRLDVLLEWSRANGFDRLPALGRGPAQRPIDRPFRLRRSEIGAGAKSHASARQARWAYRLALR